MTCCNSYENKVISIYKGFGTKWNNEDLLTVTFDSSIDLTGFGAEFYIGNTIKTYENIGGGFVINLSSQETGVLPVGPNTGTLVIVDRENHKKPFSTELPFLVKDWEGGDIKLDGFKLKINAKIQENDLLIKIETEGSDNYVREQIELHNTSETAHQYIQNLISTEESRAKGAEGVLSELTTESKTSLVSAINEVNSTKVTGNTAITGGTKCKITYDSKGLVTGGTDLGSSDVTTALGYTPYNSSNPNGYTSNVGTVTSVNNVEPVNGNVSLSIPAVNNATLTIQKNGSNVATFTANSSTNVTANISVPTNNNQLENGAGYITGISSSDVTNALGYTPYNSSNPAGYTSNVGTVTSVNNVSPVSGNVTISIPTVDQSYDGTSSNAQSGVAVKSAIDSAISSVYRPAGSVAFASLPALSSSIEGNVYNVTDSFTTTSDFVEGSGKTYPAGTNVVCIDVSGTYKWDVLAGIVDLSGYVPTSRKINNKALTSDISLTASDVGALPDSTVIPNVNNATLKIQKNGTDVATFTANSSTNETANIIVPTKTSDLTNDDGFITGINSSDVTTALGYTPYNSSNPSGYQANVIETVKVNGTALTPSSKAVDITVPTNNNQLTNGAGYITSSALTGYATETWVGQQGFLTSTALNGYATESWVGQQGYITGITSSDVTTALGYTPYDASNPNGYTSNVGTVTSVNNTSPVNGNVTLSIPTVNNSTITITQGGVTKGSFTLNQSTGDTIALDAGGGGSYTAGTGIDITNDVISVVSPTLTNGSTANWGLSLLNTQSNVGCITIGNSAQSSSSGYSTGIGHHVRATGNFSCAYGAYAYATANYAIQIGYGTNSEANSFYVGTSSSNNWKMLGGDGLIPAQRHASVSNTAGDYYAKITVDGQGNVTQSWGTVSGGGGSYTAGDGIVISNNEISVDGTEPTLVDAEVISEADSEEITEATVSDLLRTITGYDGTKTQTLKNVNGTFTWVDD